MIEKVWKVIILGLDFSFTFLFTHTVPQETANGLDQVGLKCLWPVFGFKGTFFTPCYCSPYYITKQLDFSH